MPANFDVEAVEAGLFGTRFAGLVTHLPVVNSTSTLALEAAQTGATGGVWVADEQTAGRGRGGHRWHSVAGDGLYVSTLVTPRLPLSEGLKVPLATGLAVQAAITEATGLAADIRWPNDLLLGEKKCGGILVESASDAAGGAEPMLRYAVIGIGINVNHAAFPEELEALATSLRIAAGKEMRREELLAALLRGLDRELTALDTLEGRTSLLERFAAASSWVRGKRVQVGYDSEREPDGGYTGVTAGLDARGFLQVQGDDGRLHTVISGGVRPDVTRRME
ncbi:biotin--[acetyl-CoA-carboxylase] ligase [Granulicella sp. WH15]|uniref:biotin--[acetyl-CoA-carboxylase] ligase n=1 Tax=Granulicella sp. WH15 TaxID=2602070 RepID=UPI001366A1DE|nr:biotin--[acetyl-CoA-carboxylase] ligase [Granulicella sp. WH15]QHN02166.1 biotin--[acetyl-CoA-carboxylase] ligase [Granulicella sp. WH15]